MNDLAESVFDNPLIFGVPVAIYILLFLLERWFPLRAATRELWRRILVNIGVSAAGFAAAALIVQPAATRALDASEGSFGLLNLLGLTGAVAFVVGFLVMDLSFYYWHLANHKIPVLWRFHNVHHIDPDLDITTAFRFHPGEVALSTLFRTGQVVAIGPSLTLYATYELFFVCGTIFHHSNLRLPVRLERFLNFVVVTPRMHGIHHSQFHNETDSNFSTVFSWWDRLHRTLRLNIHQRDIVIGVPGYAEETDNGFKQALLLPFRKQRAYWQMPDGTEMERRPQRLPDPSHHLVE